jgi:hypothetical protein
MKCLKVTSISAGETITLEGCLRGIIQRDGMENGSTSLCVKDKIRLVPRFSESGVEWGIISVEKEICIQYPLQLELVQCPRWNPSSSTIDISWKVRRMRNINDRLRM